MNSIDWLKSVRENGQKSPIPPVPPEGIIKESTGNTLIPPVPPCSSKLFIEGDEIKEGVIAAQEEIYWGDDQEPETSGGDRGNQSFYRGNTDSKHTGFRENQGNSQISDAEPVLQSPPVPYFTPGGTLVIPHNSDPKYHWWKGGMHVWEIREEVQARMEAETQR